MTRIFVFILCTLTSFALQAQSDPDLGEIIRSSPDLPLNYEREPRLIECPGCSIPSRPGNLVNVPAYDGSANISVLSLAEAENLFKDIATGDLGRGIDFNQIQDGCYARAHILHDRLLRRGIRTGKMFLTGNSGFRYHDPVTQEARTYTWKYHVAPVIYVRDGDRLKLMVIDPTLFNRLVPAEEWIRKQNTVPPSTFKDLFLTSGFAYMMNVNLRPVPSDFGNYHSDLRSAEYELGVRSLQTP